MYRRDEQERLIRVTDLLRDLAGEVRFLETRGEDAAAKKARANTLIQERNRIVQRLVGPEILAEFREI